MIYFQAETDNKSRSTIESKLELLQHINYITPHKVKNEIITMNQLHHGSTGPGVTDVWNSEDRTYALQIPSTGLSQLISNKTENPFNLQDDEYMIIMSLKKR